MLDERIFLVGMMGSGKTTVGRALAQRLGRPFLDSDEQVERKTGRTVAQIFADEGETAFRALEKQALTDALESEGPLVVSVAGGAVLDAGNRSRLAEGGLVVWLKAEVPTLAARVGSSDHRPLLGDDRQAALSTLYEHRRAHYAEVADVVVDVDGLSVDEVVETVVLHAGSPRQGAR